MTKRTRRGWERVAGSHNEEARVTVYFTEEEKKVVVAAAGKRGMAGYIRHIVVNFLIEQGLLPQTAETQERER